MGCESDKVAGAFPDHNPNPECGHLINFCEACLSKWVELAIDGDQFVKVEETELKGLGVKCPEADCQGVMRRVNVSYAVSGTFFRK